MKPLTLLGLGALMLGIVSFAAAASKQEEADAYTKVLKTSKDAKARAQAAEEIGKLALIKKSFAAEATPILFDMLKDKDPKVRASAATALGRVDADSEKAIPALTELLKTDKDAAVKVGAMQGLAQYGETARSALPAIREYASKDADKRLMQAARGAIKQIQAKKQ